LSFGQLSAIAFFSCSAISAVSTKWRWMNACSLYFPAKLNFASLNRNQTVYRSTKNPFLIFCCLHTYKAGIGEKQCWTLQKNVLQHWLLRKPPIFFTERWWKLLKILILTSTPGLGTTKNCQIMTAAGSFSSFSAQIVLSTEASF
jgi:hypothetical protein